MLYYNGINGIDGVILPPTVNSDIDHFDIFQNYEVEVPNRDELKEYYTEPYKTAKISAIESIEPICELPPELVILMACRLILCASTLVIIKTSNTLTDIVNFIICN
jgi:hypothetical protein